MKNWIRKILAKKFRISYSQLGEDILAAELLKKKCGVVYVDIGANHPIFGSNTFYYYLRGGHGICVEPNSDFEKIHRKTRPRDHFICSAVTNRHEKQVSFHKSASSTDSFASFDDKNSTPSLFVNNNHINDILSRISDAKIDFLSLDTETMDAEILEAIDFSNYFIKAICVETNKSEQDAKRIEDFLCRKGYKLQATNPVNSIFCLEQF